jgi:type IV pilus assembly protein PilA
MSKHFCRGFTFIELMLVVGIIGVLAGIAVPAYQDYTIRSRIAEALVLAGPVQKAVRDYYDRWGVFPSDNAAAGLQAAERYIGNNVRGIRVEQGLVSIALIPNIVPKVNQPELHLRPAVNSAAPTAPFVWLCEGGSPPAGMQAAVEMPAARLTLPNKYLPAICRSRT